MHVILATGPWGAPRRILLSLIVLALLAPASTPALAAAPQDSTDSIRKDLRVVNERLISLSWQIEQAIEDLSSKEEEIIDNGSKLNRAKAEMTTLCDAYNKRIAGIYRHGTTGPLKFLLNSSGFKDFLVTTEFLIMIGEQDSRLMKRITRLESEIKRRQARLQVATIRQRQAVDRLEKAKQELIAALGEQQAAFVKLPFGSLQGIPKSAGGLVFPVAPPYTFVDSWGAPRMMGTAASHSHQGVDIMALAWTRVLAIEDGVIIKMGTNKLGGISLWLRGDGGTKYYYAHLNRYAKGLRQGGRVEAGQLVGYIGDTGNAKGTPHLHFEVHPPGKGPVNPYPLLLSIDSVSRAAYP